jgi:hypothetical protein
MPMTPGALRHGALDFLYRSIYKEYHSDLVSSILQLPRSLSGIRDCLRVVAVTIAWERVCITSAVARAWMLLKPRWLPFHLPISPTYESRRSIL